jgi:hypothetical protein
MAGVIAAGARRPGDDIRQGGKSDVRHENCEPKKQTEGKEKPQKSEMSRGISKQGVRDKQKKDEEKSQKENRAGNNRTAGRGRADMPQRRRRSL